MDTFWHAVADFAGAAYAWVFGWQTLVGAILALIVAVVTIFVMEGQRRDEALRHKDAQRRKKMAARAQMPDALSELGAYVRACANRIKGQTNSLPDEPVAAVSALKEVIEFIDDDAAARSFELVSWYQVFRARNAHDVPDPAHPNFGEQMYDAALLQTYINSLYEYARNEGDSVDASKPSREEVTEGLKNAFTLIHMVQNDELYDSVKTIIARRHKPAHA